MSATADIKKIGGIMMMMMMMKLYTSIQKSQCNMLQLLTKHEDISLAMDWPNAQKRMIQMNSRICAVTILRKCILYVGQINEHSDSDSNIRKFNNNYTCTQNSTCSSRVNSKLLWSRSRDHNYHFLSKIYACFMGG